MVVVVMDIRTSALLTTPTFPPSNSSATDEVVGKWISVLLCHEKKVPGSAVDSYTHWTVSIVVVLMSPPGTSPSHLHPACAASLPLPAWKFPLWFEIPWIGICISGVAHTNN